MSTGSNVSADPRNTQQIGDTTGGGHHPPPFPSPVMEGELNRENLYTGYIRFYRSIERNPLWKQHPPIYLKIWILCLIRANWQDTKWWDGKQEITVPEGSFVSSLLTLSRLSGGTIKQVRGCLQYLLAAHSITIKRTQRYSIITICNWKDYQRPEESSGHIVLDDKGHTEGTTRAQSGHSEGTVRAQAKEVKNLRREEFNNSERPTTPKNGTVDYASLMEFAKSTWPRPIPNHQLRLIASQIDTEEEARLFLEHTALYVQKHGRFVIAWPDWMDGAWRRKPPESAKAEEKQTFSERHEQARRETFMRRIAEDIANGEIQQ